METKKKNKKVKSLFWYLERIGCLLLCILISLLAIFCLWAFIVFLILFL